MRAPVTVSTVLATWTRALVSETVRAPADRAALLRRHGVDPATFNGRDARLDHDAACEIWATLTEAHPDPIFGVHFAREVSAASLGVVGYLAMSSATAKDALRRVGAYHRLVKGDGAVDIAERGEVVRVVDGPGRGRGPWPRHLAEAVLFAYRACIERWSGRSVVPCFVRFQHSAPPEARLVAAAFGCRTSFSTTVNEIAFEASQLASPLVTSDEALVDYLSPVADQLLGALPAHDSLLTEVQRAIRATMPSGDVSLARVARQLGVGGRTLQRRLRERKVSFHEVVDGVREGAARRLLGDRTLGVEDVAFLLGYADSSSFRRAHRRWTGRAPHEARLS